MSKPVPAPLAPRAGPVCRDDIRKESILPLHHRHESEVEARLVEADCTIVGLTADNKNYIDGFQKAGAIEYVDKIMADPEIFSIVSEKEQYNAICEILDMPFWKYRYEMYSAWVFTCIAKAFSDLGIRYNIQDGVLQFKSSGVMLATISLPDMEFEIWAEKRHPANNLLGEGRVSGIQPDYTIYSKTKEKTEVCIVIECKQYKKSNKKNFASAVSDYATALPSAMVLLTNYGRISKNFSKWFKLEILRRSKDYGMMRPDTEIQSDFISDVRNYAEVVGKITNLQTIVL